VVLTLLQNSDLISLILIQAELVVSIIKKSAHHIRADIYPQSFLQDLPHSILLFPYVSGSQQAREKHFLLLFSELLPFFV
jgi:hypothetical protein